MPSDPPNLARFVDAQARIYPIALAELVAGRKDSHWMWYVFPQIAGLGFSPTALFYAIASADEARAYLDHPVLGARLRESTRALLAHAGKSADSILGAVDALKLRSSMTLFETVAEPDDPFGRCLLAFFAGERDPATLRLLGRAGTRPPGA
jgi:uncharacterized protein (DUF1810 family)